MASTPTLEQFLRELGNIIRAGDGEQMRNYMIIEPPYNDLYQKMINEVRQNYPKEQEGALDDFCRDNLPEARDGIDGVSWTAFIYFIAQYFTFIRDVNVDNLLDTYNLFSEVMQKISSALGHSTLGIILLPTVIEYSKVFAKLAIGLDKQPELIANAVATTSDEGGEGETLPERAGNIIRSAFTTCLNDRNSSGIAPDNTPDSRNKKSGIYKLANLCLKIFFQCRKIRNCEQIFTNIYNQSPPLSIYPKAQQVTYLYYLGRFQFANSHFWRAQLALQHALDLTPANFISQRRLILIYLLTSNLLLGRFPSAALYSLPEARGLRQHFGPLCRAIARGDIPAFQQLTSLETGPSAGWLYSHKVLLEIRYRGFVLVQRSLTRLVFLVAGDPGDPEARKAPTLDISAVHTALRYLEHRPPQAAVYVDPDFEGMDPAELNYLDEDGEPNPLLLPTFAESEALIASMIDQNLINGFISHRQGRLAIQGAKRKAAVAAGWPKVWEVIVAKFAGEEVPGWKKDGAGGTGMGGGMVVNLSGVRGVS
ncbi:hypothetical protein M501DRAFT_972917 [Patellaria atrata CBS 101060]|uniref:PCI domain-containing protein n=1 Tax=Patellaria atrata CBS 101060 TaxID=1346257 RepID=A0A9P4SB96_9PEZI|nr:hypothetical protein M501DRAFT_972917 [Patellaria atrata CBS 101060]